MKKRLFTFFLTLVISINCLAVFSFAENEIKQKPVPEITAQNAIVINTNTNAVVYEKDADEKIYPASLTKMVTLLVASELISDYSQTITVTDDCYDDLVIGSSNIDLKDEEVISLENLMYAIAVSSANEAANALAIHLCGSTAAFVEKMNAKAKQLGANNTHFINAHGLHDPEHYTTARDMSLIAKAIFANEKLVKFLSTPIHVIEPTNKKLNKRTLVTTNSLIYQNSGKYYKYCKAGKTGTTTAAGYNLVTIGQKGEMEFIVVAMNVEKKSGGTNTVFDDTKALYNWAFENYKSAKILNESDLITEVPVKLSVKGDYLVLVPDKNVYSVIPIDLDIATLEREIVTEQEIFAPISQGDKLGTITLKKDGVVYATCDLVAGNDIERSTVLYYLYLIEMFFKNIWVRIICIILAIFLIIYIVLIISHNRRRKSRHNKKLRRFIKL